MFRQRTSIALFVLALGLLAAPGLSAQNKRPDFSGAWQQDVEASKALTEKKGHVWRVAGAGTGAAGAGQAAVPAGATVMAPVTTITQSNTEVVLERRFEGEVLSRDVYKLDGSVSVNVNASRNSSSRSTTVWKGASLVTTGTIEFDFSDSHATDASGKPITEITRQFVTTRTLMPDGTMQVESRTTQNGEERVSWSVMVRVKPS